MKKFLLMAFLSLAVASVVACGGDDNDNVAPSGANDNNNQETTATMKINIKLGGKAVTATMDDNAAARDFVSRLPLTVKLEDFNSTTEKIFYPVPTLSLDGLNRGCAPQPGDITIYEPWGNVAIFCKPWPYSSDLIKIGHIEDNGMAALAVKGDVEVVFEKAEQ